MSDTGGYDLTTHCYKCRYDGYRYCRCSCRVCVAERKAKREVVERENATAPTPSDDPPRCS